MYCGICGTQVPDGSGFCPNCGSKIQPVSIPKAVNIPAEPIPAPNIPTEPIPAPNIPAEVTPEVQTVADAATEQAEAEAEQAGWAAAVAAAQKAAAEQAARREAEGNAAREAEEAARREAEAAAREAEEAARREAEAAAAREAAERAEAERVAREIAAQEEAARKAAEQQAAQAAQEAAEREAARKAAEQQAAQAAQEAAAREAARKAAEQQAAQAAQEAAAREAARKAAEQQAAAAAVQAAQAAAQSQNTGQAAAPQQASTTPAPQPAQVTGAPQYQMINGHYVLVPKQLQQIQPQPQGVAPAPQTPTKSSKRSLGFAGGLAVLTLIFAFLALVGAIWLFFRNVDGRKWLPYDLIAAMAIPLYLLIGTCIFLKTKNYSYDFAAPGMAVSFTLISFPKLIPLISAPSGYLRELPKTLDQWLRRPVPLLLLIGLVMIIGCASMMYPKKLNAANYAQKALAAKFLSVIHALVTLASIASIAIYDFWKDTLHNLIKQFDYIKSVDMWWLTIGTNIVYLLAIITGLLMFVAAGFKFRKSLTQKGSGYDSTSF